MIGEREEFVAGVLLIEVVEPFLRARHCEVTFEVSELRLDGLGLGVDNVFEESALLVVVCRYRGDLRLLNLMDRRVVALELEDTDITICEETVGEVDDLLLRHL